MPQTLDVISINIWHILISLINLVLMFLILKRFLFKPTKKLLADRQQTIDRQYEAARQAEAQAQANRDEWEEKLHRAETEAAAVLKEAADGAQARAEQIVEDANLRASEIVARAEAQAELERRRATDEIKQEIVEVSSAIAEKMLEREVNTDDHRAMIDAFIETIGDEHDTDQ